MTTNRHHPIDDAMLVAFVDGELDPGDAFAVQEALRDDTELQDRVRVMRESASILRAAYGRIAHERLPVDMVRMVAEAPPLPPGRSMGAGSRRPRTAWGPMAMAASVALVVGVAGGWLGAAFHGSGSAPVIISANWPAGATQLVQRVLEKEISGTTVSWTDPGSNRQFTVQPIRTFHDPTRGFCREYRESTRESTSDSISPDTTHTVYGLACRSAEGVWNVEYYLLPGDVAHRL